MNDFQPILYRVPGFEPSSGSPAAGSTPDRESAAPASTPSATRSENPAACGRVDRPSLRANRSAPAGIRRAQRAAHTAQRRPAPPGSQEFATTTLRILLEVLDRRRPVAQLATLCAPALVRAIGTLVAGDHVPSRTLGAAALTSVRLLPAGERAAELVAMYQRGPRRLAIAGRIELDTRKGWTVTALRLM
ncbi:Rv3235 family protein [Nocardia sp. NPDC024068]|uniref:Rv3235 family protein n=1 Tax=Nocardia sp. NPDC024068 TaxID=3157197 RepID=UPI003405EAC2